ncbi:flavodoxin family protein [Anaerotignum sp.]
MKVLLINGSPNGHGCTYTALKEIEKTLRAEGVETEMFYLGNKPISGCMGCRQCYTLGKCVIDDVVNKVMPKAIAADGIIVGSPVHYAAASGQATSFLDRLFYSSAGRLAYKPGAAIVSCRRGGASAAFDQLNKYFTISNMPIVSGNYWNQIHGNTPEEVKQDLEGMQNMRVIGRNMAWLLKCIEAGKNAGIDRPEGEEKIMTNFIR